MINQKKSWLFISLPMSARLRWLTLLGGCLLFSSLARAQTPALQFEFEDAPGTTTASTGSTSVSLNLFNAAAVATDLHGATGSGVLGSINGNRALNFTSAPNYAV